MERIRRSLIAVVSAHCLALGAGCVTTTTTQPHVRGDMQAPIADNPVKQASATIPGATLTMPSLAKLTGKPDQARNQATQIAALWQNKPAFLPDPSKNGSMGMGIVGQILLMTPDDKFATAEGKLTVEMFDESIVPGQNPTSKRIDGWIFDKETFKKLVSSDERLGRSYVLFLPWTTYSPAITRVRLTVRYDPDHGFPLYAEASMLQLDTSTLGQSGSGSVPGNFPSPPSGVVQTGGFMGPGAAQQQVNPAAGLQPIAYTRPVSR